MDAAVRDSTHEPITSGASARSLAVSRAAHELLGPTGMRLVSPAGASTSAGVVLVLALAAPAHAQLPDPVDPSTIGDGPSLDASAGLLGETTSDGAAALDGEVAIDAAWTRSGIDRTEGFRGPRWTNRWGARIAALAAAGNADRPLDLEERGEVALYAGSIGEFVTWQSHPRLTDRIWYRSTDLLAVGAFGDFAGLGLVKRDDDDELGAEAFPMFVSVARDVSGGGATTLELDFAVARVAGRGGDVRLVDERIAERRLGDARAASIDVAALSIRRLELAKHSPWTFSLDILGLTAVSGYVPANGPLLGDSTTIMPLARVGIVHHADALLRAERSEISRPLVDDTDFGAEFGTLHRLVEGAGVDEGAQLLAWWRRVVGDGVAMRGEAMLGIADRVSVPAMAPPGVLPTWVDSSGLVYVARGELELSAQLARGFALEARVWIEHSERADPSQQARWTNGVQSGIAWRM
jgi:hypothetical protein